MAQITKKHNLDELYALGYQPIEGEIFQKYSQTKHKLVDVEFVSYDPRPAFSPEFPDDMGVIYKEKFERKNGEMKAITFSCYPMSQLKKEVTYEVIFK